MDLRPCKIEPEVFEPVPIVIDERSREGLQDGRTVIRVTRCFDQHSTVLQLALGNRGAHQGFAVWKDGLIKLELARTPTPCGGRP